MTLGIALLACAVLGLGAVLKVRDLQAFRSSLRRLGVPSCMLPLAWLVPALEAALAAAWMTPCRQQGAFATLVALACFSTMLVVAGSSGRSGACLCFGKRFERKYWLGPVAAVLLSCASVVTAATDLETAQSCGSSPPLWLVGSVAVVVVFLSVVVLTRVTAAPGRGFGSARRSTKTENRGLAGMAQERLVNLADGSTLQVAALLSERRVLALVFASRDCDWYNAVVPELEAWSAKVAGWIDVALVYAAGSATPPTASKGMLVRRVAQADGGLSRRLGVAGTPSMVYLLPDGSLAGPVIGGLGAMRIAMRRLEDRIGSKAA